MTPEQMQAFGVQVAVLVEAKVKEQVQAVLGELRGMLATAGNAGHAAITRVDQVENRMDLHDVRLNRIERELGLPPLEIAGE